MACRCAYRVLVVRPEENGQLRRQRHRWEYNLKTDLKEVELEDMEEAALAHRRDWNERL
jgi:hypothetical protein